MLVLEDTIVENVEVVLPELVVVSNAVTVLEDVTVVVTAVSFNRPILLPPYSVK